MELFFKSSEVGKTEPHPNPALKGVKGGNCNRTACQSPGADYYHKTMHKHYCRTCALLLNQQAALHGFDPFFTDL